MAKKKAARRFDGEMARSIAALLNTAKQARMYRAQQGLVYTQGQWESEWSILPDPVTEIERVAEVLEKTALSLRTTLSEWKEKGL